MHFLALLVDFDGPMHFIFLEFRHNNLVKSVFVGQLALEVDLQSSYVTEIGTDIVEFGRYRFIHLLPFLLPAQFCPGCHLAVKAHLFGQLLMA